MMDAAIIVEINAHEDRLLAAQKAHSVEALEALLDDNLLAIGPDGTTLGKEDDLEAYRSGVFTINKLDHLSREIRILTPDVALCSVLADAEGSAAGEPVNGKLRYFRVWQRFEAQWRVVGATIMPVG